MRKALKILLAALVLVSGCTCEKQKEDLTAFMADTTVRLSRSGTPQFVYDARTCQLGFNRSRCEFSAFKDDQTDYFILTLDSIPTQEDEEVHGSLSWTTSSNISILKDIALEAVRIEGDRIWFWCSAMNLGAVVRVLE